MSEDDARAYLEKKSNYFRLRAYRLGFPKVEEGARKWEYANLDFKMLVDLSIVDRLLRYEMLPLTLDVEHFATVKLLKRIEMEGEDGYAVVPEYICVSSRGLEQKEHRKLSSLSIGSAHAF